LALTEKSIRRAIAMTNKFTIMGKVLPAGDILPKLMTVINTSVRIVIIVTENKKYVQTMLDYISDRAVVKCVIDIQEVLRLDFVEENQGLSI
jgi:ATP-dependent Lon protease